MTLWKITITRWDCPHGSCDPNTCRKGQRRVQMLHNPQEAIDLLTRRGQLKLDEVGR